MAEVWLVIITNDVNMRIYFPGRPIPSVISKRNLADGVRVCDQRVLLICRAVMALCVVHFSIL